MTQPLTARRWYFLQLLFALTGAGLSLYLLLQHTRLKSGIQGGSALCSLGKYADCNVVNASAHAQWGPVPIAAVGALYFLTLLLLGAFHSPGTKGFRVAQVWMARLSAIALTVDLWLLGVQAFALGTFCLLCLATYACTLGHLAMNWLLRPAPQRTLASFLRKEKKGRLGPTALAATLGLLLLSTGVLYSWTSSPLVAQRLGQIEDERKIFLKNWPHLPKQTIPIKAEDAVWGNPLAPVKVIVFSDFECPHCQRAAFALHAGLAQDKDRVAMVFKHFPLDHSCNPLVTQPIHPNACALAQLGYCANQKKRFWEYHDRIFFKLSAREISSSHENLFTGVKPFFTRNEFDACLKNEAAKANTLADIELGEALQVTSTPTVFINGKRVGFGLTVDLIRQLVEMEAKATGPSKK